MVGRGQGIQLRLHRWRGLTELDRITRLAVSTAAVATESTESAESAESIARQQLAALEVFQAERRHAPPGRTRRFKPGTSSRKQQFEHTHLLYIGSFYSRHPSGTLAVPRPGGTRSPAFAPFVSA
jgi:hypothetical protein